MANLDALVTDNDGTLVDSVLLIRHGQYEAATTFLTRHGLPEDSLPSYEAYESLLNKSVGGSARQTLELTVKTLYEDESHHLEGMDFDELHDLLDPIQDRIAPTYIKAFPGLADLLSRIGKMGTKLAIFSSGTPHHVVRNLGIALAPQVGDYSELYMRTDIDNTKKLEMFKQRLMEVFDIKQLTVVTCDDVGEETKPNPKGINIAMQRLGVLPEGVAVLGDHSFDIQAGVNAGVARKIGITHGFDDVEVLRLAGADTVIDSLVELPEILAG